MRSEGENDRETEKKKRKKKRVILEEIAHLTVVFRCIKIEYVSLIYTHAHTHSLSSARLSI